MLTTTSPSRSTTSYPSTWHQKAATASGSRAAIVTLETRTWTVQQSIQSAVGSALSSRVFVGAAAVG